MRDELSASSLTDDDLVRLQRDTFKYFADEVNPENGLVRDNTRRGSPSSIAAVGFALTAYPIAVERKYMTRTEAVKRTHLSHMWIDFRGIQDDYMRGKSIDYFENSRRAIYAQQTYAMRNPKKFAGYGRFSWGITASDGPGPAERRVNGRRMRFFDYRARSIPYGPDDGTLAPWAVADQKLPHGFHLAPDATLPVHRKRSVPRGLSRRLVRKSV